jgi:phasin family protein
MVKTAEELVTFGQGNVEAVIKSGQALANGVQTLTKQMAATAQANLEETILTFKAIATARSVREALDLQAALARSTIEKAMTQSGHVAESTLKLTEQVVAPIASRLTLAVETFGRAA